MPDYLNYNNYHAAMAAMQRDWLSAKLTYYQWNISQTARMIGLTRQMLHYLIRLHDLKSN